MRKCPTRYRGGSSSTEAGEVARRTSAERRNPARGVRSLVGSFNPADVGSFRAGDSRNRT
jgi:hypothetical protein